MWQTQTRHDSSKNNQNDDVATLNGTHTHNFSYKHTHTHARLKELKKLTRDHCGVLSIALSHSHLTHTSAFIDTISSGMMVKQPDA